MNMKMLETFAQTARRQLQEQIGVKLERVLTAQSLERRENPQAVKDLEKQIAQSSKAAVIERVAYTWFNRFCALRYMDVNHYTRIGTVSPASGFTQPELLQEAKQGHIDDDLARYVTRQLVFDLLGGQRPSADPQQEAYRHLLVAVCNHYHTIMPFMFEKIDDYTELLMPDDLLSASSVLQAMREALTPGACKDVEVIGWLYQFYISEKKDEIMARKGAVPSEDVPARTQLFTPHYIVRYLVENSLGRLWLLNHPNSRLAEQMEYYIEPEQAETDFLRIDAPEELKICDPAAGSGHMLTYAFDLLYAIYEEAGYNAVDIPQLILTRNLYGIEIDPRAGMLAAFSLTMKAREKDRRYLRRLQNADGEEKARLAPNVCILEDVRFTGEEINNYMEKVGQDLFTQDLWVMFRQFEQATTFGSLIRPQVKDVSAIRERLQETGVFGDIFLHSTNDRVLKVLEMAEYLSPRYHVVVANPPYMGSRSMNEELKTFAQDHYPESKSDLFAMFIERNLDLATPRGLVAMITMQSWMFLSTFEKLRVKLLNHGTITSMAHLGARAFDSISGEVVQTTAFVIEHAKIPQYQGGYLRLVDGNNETEKATAIVVAVDNPDCGWFYRASAADFKKIPGAPVAYWVSQQQLLSFSRCESLENFATSSNGIQTTNNALYLRQWHEVSQRQVRNRWFPYNKGGTYRKWYGNNEFYVNWENNGAAIKAEKNGMARGEEFYFHSGITWSDVTSGTLSSRLMPNGFLFDASGPSAFTETDELLYVILAFLNTKFAAQWSKILNPTMHFQSGDFRKLTLCNEYIRQDVINVSQKLTHLAKLDWDSYEISWDFYDLQLLQQNYRGDLLSDTYTNLRSDWHDETQEMQRLEEENNRFLIEAYGLQDELTPDVPLEDITLTCNPHYRYGANKNEEELEALLLADTMREFISYAVGCMFGRYSLDKPGLILANQGDMLDDYLRQVPNPTFMPDADNAIPLLEDEWFTDDITERFKRFLRVTFGEEHYEENLHFIEDALGKDIRRYFLREFYDHHLKMYQKRPIYWLFSSPNGSFNALIYMHRYQPHTVSVILNDYLREFRTKLAAEKAHQEHISISAASSPREKTQALKAIEKLDRVLKEVTQYEDEILYPLATRQVTIDLDDGVKVNYNKIGPALKKVTGLSEW